MEVTAGLSIPKAEPARRRPGWLIDYGERALLILLYLLLVERLAPSLGRQPVNTLLLLSESIVVGFVVLRRRTADVTRDPADWMLALGGTIAPLFMLPGGSPIGPSAIAGVVMVVGILTHVGAKLSLRRSFGMAAANRGVKVGGLYRFIRHPMYLGYAITWIGFLLGNPTPVNAALIVVAASMQAARILAEERLLSGDAVYRAYAARVRFRVIPGLF
ncbi:MAG TPA: methyltransferase [Caulobacteraceae bacterium]|nr:methyltransferase [Caulobacteraceae bacterium]